MLRRSKAKDRKTIIRMQSVTLISTVFVRRSSHLGEMGYRSKNSHLPAVPEAAM